MLRCLAVAALLGMIRVQDAPAPADLERWRTAFSAQRLPEAAKILEDLAIAHPRWKEFPELAIQLANHFGEGGDVERGALLALLRLVQKTHPEQGRGYPFERAAENVLGWGFIDVPARVSAGPLRLPLEAPAPDEGKRGTSIVTSYWVPPSLLERARKEVLATPDDPRRLWMRIPRESWTRQGRQLVEETAPAGPELKMDALGLYVLEEKTEGLTRLSSVVLSSWAVVTKTLPGELLAFAVRPDSGEPVGDVRISVAGGGKVQEARTGPDGLVRLAVSGAQRLIADREHEYQDLFLEQETATSGALVYISTDRPVYRPGQAVCYKALRRDRDGGRLILPASEKVRVEVRDPLGRVIHAQEPAWNAQGSLSGSLVLGEEPPLGTYTVLVHVPDPEGFVDGTTPALWQSSFSVAAYRKPEMAVRVEFPSAGTAVLGDRVRALIRADYYFGGPVAAGEVEWNVLHRVARRPVVRPIETDASRSWFLQPKKEPFADLDWISYRSGKGVLQADGTCAVDFDPQELEGQQGREHEFQVVAGVVDLSRFSAEGAGTISVPPAAVRVALEVTRRFVRPGDPLEVRVRASKPDGRAAEGQEVELTAFADAGPRGEEKEVEFESFFRGTARSGADGRAAFTLTPEAAGRLRLRARAKDERGRISVDRLDLPVETDAFDRDLESDELTVIPEKDVYQAGDTARLLVRAPRKGLRALLTVEADRFHAATLVTLKRNTETLELAVGADWPPQVVVKLCAWKQDVAYGGGATLAIYPRDGVVEVGVRADKAVYAPGEKARVALSTSVGGAELELGIVDESIFAVQKEVAGDIRSFFHRKTGRRAELAGTVRVVDYGDHRGGPLTGALVAIGLEASAEDENASVRRYFPDTLAWKAHLVTDAQGKAELEVEIPDSLTAWRFTARAVAGAARFGEARSSAVCRKEIMVRLAAPRFLTERDLGTVSTIVHNGRAEDATFRVRLEAEGLEVAEAERELRVRAGGAERLDWAVLARKAGPALLRARASSPAGGDAVELRLPVLPHGVEELAGATGVVDARWTGTLVLPEGALPDSAVLKVSVSSPGLPAVMEALPFLAGYPYGCVEQTLSRFLPSVVAAQALRRLAIPNDSLAAELPKMAAQGLQRLYDFQHEDGGWGWWKTDPTHKFMTAYAMYGLLTARAAGFEVREDVLQRGLERLETLGSSPLGAWVRARMGRPIDEDLPPDGQEDLAWLVLAGRKDLAPKLEVRVPARGGSGDVRTAALTLRALHAVDPKDARIPKLVEWLMLQRQGSIWNSTLDTAYVVFALCDLVEGRPEPGFRVRVNGRELPAVDGRVRVDAAGLRAGANAVEVERRGEGLLFASALLSWRTSAEAVKPAAGAIEVTRTMERRTAEGQWEPIASGAEVKAGEDLRVLLSVRAKGAEAYVLLECPLPAGAEAREDRPGDWEGHSWYARRELRDDRVCVAIENLPGDALEVAFRVRPVLPGEYHVMPARAFAMYDPDRRGYSGEFILRVRP